MHRAGPRHLPTREPCPGPQGTGQRRGQLHVPSVSEATCCRSPRARAALRDTGTRSPARRPLRGAGPRLPPAQRARAAASLLPPTGPSPGTGGEPWAPLPCSFLFASSNPNWGSDSRTLHRGGEDKVTKAPDLGLRRSRGPRSPSRAGRACCHPSLLPRRLEDGGGGTGKPPCLQPQAGPLGSTGHQPRPNVPPKGQPVLRAGRGRWLSRVPGSESARWVTQQVPCAGAPGKAPDAGPRDRTLGGTGRRVPTAELHEAPIHSKHPTASKPTPHGHCDAELHTDSTHTCSPPRACSCVRAGRLGPSTCPIHSRGHTCPASPQQYSIPREPPVPPLPPPRGPSWAGRGWDCRSHVWPRRQFGPRGCGSKAEPEGGGEGMGLQGL